MELSKCDVPWVVPITNVMELVVRPFLHGTGSYIEGIFPNSYLCREEGNTYTHNWFHHICNWYYPWDVTF
eukprot:10346190-Ditylum_brightwellii.AAC.1